MNVTGSRTIKMAELRDLAVSLGFTDVETYLQSGNLIFNTKLDGQKVAGQLSSAIAQTFGYPDVAVLVLSESDLTATVDGNPFVASGADLKKLHVTFASKAVDSEAFSKLDLGRFQPDQAILGPKAIYVYCPNGYGTTKLNNAFFEKKLGIVATTRNWQTVNQLIQKVRG
ncbi:MAG: DUF1697 domain-containing protein [Polyangiaceae bacterium]|nr:DUF1697 domain-containing protein [Polyangiaceae bacterium]